MVREGVGVPVGVCPCVCVPTADFRFRAHGFFGGVVKVGCWFNWVVSVVLGLF